MLWQGLIFRFCHSIMVVSSPQHGEHTAFFFSFPFGGIHNQGILPVIPLELQEKKHQPFFRLCLHLHNILKLFDYFQTVEKFFSIISNCYM